MRFAPYPDVSLKDSDAARSPDDSAAPAPPDRAAGPLTDEQMAFYRQRMESGFYRSDAVRRHIAERLADEVLPNRPG